MNRCILIFAALAGAVVLAFGLVIGLNATAVLDGDGLTLVLAGELLVLLGLIAAAWAWFELHLLRPLRGIADDVAVVTHGNIHHGLRVRDGHALGRLPEAVDELVRDYRQARNDTAKAMETASARADRARSRLETVLRDVSEGVVMCTTGHRVVLYNDAAVALLGPLGLNRSLTGVVDQQALRDALSRLYQHAQAGMPRTRHEFRCTVSGGEEMPARMQALHEPGRGVSGYVLCLGAAQPAAGREERPVYYDFDLFDGEVARELRDVPLSRLDCVVFDSETTGLEPSRGDRLIELAGVRIVNGRLREEEQFSQLANPGMAIPRASTRIHGITDDMVRDAVKVAEVVRDFHGWTAGEVLLAHNAAFDMRFLELQEEASEVSFRQPVLDSLLLSVLMNPEEQNHTLAALMDRLGVTMDDGERHRALGDAVATARAFTRMVRPLAARGIVTLGDALDASATLYTLRRQQRRF